MKTENPTKEEIQKEINKNLNELLKSAFIDDEYDIQLRNLIKSIGFIASGILETIDCIESDETGHTNERFLNKIKDQCFCVDTLCDTIDKTLDSDGFVAVSNLVYEQKRLNDLEKF